MGHTSVSMRAILLLTILMTSGDDYCGAVGHWSLNCPEKQKKEVPAQNEVLPLINTNYCLETYEYDNEIVVIHNVKARLK